jgi:hypothetical protein
VRAKISWKGFPFLFLFFLLSTFGHDVVLLAGTIIVHVFVCVWQSDDDWVGSKGRWCDNSLPRSKHDDDDDDL